MTFNGRKKVLNIKLWEIAHSHTGDKGDISNVSLIAYNAEDFELLKEKGYTTYKIRQEKLIGQGTLTALKNGTGGLDAKTIARLCEVLDCQPGDLMEYIKESVQENS